MPKVLITDDVSPLLIDGLVARNYEVAYLPAIDRTTVLATINDYEGLIINSKIVCNQELLDLATQLRWIGRLGSGMEVIDTKYCEIKNIRFFNSPDGNAQAVAEHALGLLLSLLRNIPKANAEVKELVWSREPNRGIELQGKTIGIIGFGHTGAAFAQLLPSFGVKILAHDKYKINFGTAHVIESRLVQIFEEADIVSIHLPLTTETTYFVDAHFLSNFNKSIFLINTSRGKVLNTAELAIKISQQKVLGAALDVLENENILESDSKYLSILKQLIGSPNVLLTPHIAGWTQESKIKIAESILRSIDNIPKT